MSSSILAYHILQFLSYSERTTFIRLCHSMKLSLDRFIGVQVHRIIWPGRTDPSYLLVHHPYPTPFIHPHTYIGHHYLSLILYDTPFSYYHIRCMRPYEERKPIQDYLSEYDPSIYDINHVIHPTE